MRIERLLKNIQTLETENKGQDLANLPVIIQHGGYIAPVNFGEVIDNHLRFRYWDDIDSFYKDARPFTVQNFKNFLLAHTEYCGEHIRVRDSFEDPLVDVSVEEIEGKTPALCLRTASFFIDAERRRVLNENYRAACESKTDGEFVQDLMDRGFTHIDFLTLLPTSALETYNHFLAVAAQKTKGVR